jgi:hypothetical protein
MLQCSVGHCCSTLSTIVATSQAVMRPLPAMVVTPQATSRHHNTASYWPSPQHRKLPAIIVAPRATSHCHNVTSCRTLLAIATTLQVVSHYRSVTLPGATVYRHRPPSQQQRSIFVRLTFIKLLLDFHMTSIGRPFDFHWTFVGRSFKFCPTTILSYCHIAFWRPTSYCSVVLRLTVLLSCLSMRCLFDFCSTFVQPSLDIRLTSVRCLFIAGHFQRRIIFLNCTLSYNFVASVVYYHKILGHGTTPCPRMMKALPLSQSPNISYEVTHNPLSQFL